MKKFVRQKKRNRRLYLSVISFVAMSCGAAMAQTDLAATNSVADTSTNVANLGNITVVGQLDEARSQIVPDLGATAYTQTKEQIENSSQGGNAPMSQVVLRAPGVAQDNEASGDLHVRGEHANVQYRINDVLLPEGISGFGAELDPRFIDSVQLITGSLPAQYGFRTAGVIDIQTKSGAFENGGAGEIYGGSYGTIRPSFEYGGSTSNLNYFVDGSYDHNDLGIENPTPSHSAIHDTTDQFKLFSYWSYVLDDTSRLNFMASASHSTFEVPNTPGLPAGINSDTGMPWGNQMTSFNSSTNSANVNENQVEQNYYFVTAYQKSAGKLNYQAAGFLRNSDVHFRPDQIGDLYFNGEASDVNRRLFSVGVQTDGSYELNDKHTLRGGFMALEEYVSADSATTVFAPADSSTLETIMDNHVLHGLFAGVYLQDEWKLLEQLTLNYGARFDEFYSSFDKENQVSPRVNLIYTPTDSTTLHAGYSRYFTPPPLEDVSGESVAKFDNTSGQAANFPADTDTAPKSERANYFDAGISQKVGKHLQLGVDGYYKTARNQLDDGLFGQSLVLSAFNYAKGKIYGVEFTGSYNIGGFSSYANVAWSQAYGKDWNSSQFLFDPGDAAYTQNHWIYLDHDQRVTGSFGVAYTWSEGRNKNTRVYSDALYGSGLRTDSPTAPNGASVPSYYSINIGAEQSFPLSQNKILKARIDVVNLTDNSYVLRDGGGVGVNAASYGERLGFFGSLSLVF